MKNMPQQLKKKGFTMIEMIVVMVVIAVILGAVLPALVGASDNSRLTSTLSSIRGLQTASVNFYNANGGSYASTGSLGIALSLANLSAQNMLPANVTGTNSWGGTISLTPDTNASSFDITLTKVPPSVGNATNGTLTMAVANLTQTAPTYTASSETWQAAF